MFEDSLGTLKGYEAKILVDPNVLSCFCKARSVPYSMRVLVDEKLDQLVHRRKSSSQLQYADWAAPIVTVLKSDKKSIRICGDFQPTVNQALRLDKYRIPKIEQLCTKLAGGKLFTKLDMRQAYQQLLLEFHESHPRETRMKTLMHMYVWWAGIGQDIEAKYQVTTLGPGEFCWHYFGQKNRA